jgi:L-iditol 2-dehydrogenase
MAEMKALNLYGIHDLRYEDVAMPKYGNDEVLLRVKAVGICGSDIPRVFHKGTYHFPTIIGHEFAGEIVEAGDESLLGRRATVFPLLPCGACEACKEGKYAQCSHYDYYGSRRDGAMSEYIAVKKRNLVFMPPEVSYKAAAMSEPAAVALHAFRKAAVGLGNTIVIFGVGPIGLILASWAREAGVENIVLVARNQAKVQFAKKLGFLQAIDSTEVDVHSFVRGITEDRGADACIEGTGTSEALEYSVLCTRNFGRVVALGNPLGDMRLSQQAYWQILRKELCVVGTWNSSFSSKENDWQEVMIAMRDRVIDVENLITHVFSFAEYKEAFQLMHEKKEPYCKVMFVNEGED